VDATSGPLPPIYFGGVFEAKQNLFVACQIQWKEKEKLLCNRLNKNE